jgi:hypothetical protein
MKTQVIWDIKLPWLMNSYWRFDDLGALNFRVKQPKGKGISHFRNVRNSISVEERQSEKYLDLNFGFFFYACFKRVRMFLHFRVFLHAVIIDT